MASIDLENVNLSFTIRQVKHLTLKEYLVRGLFFRKTMANTSVQVHALQNISLQLRDGDRLGIIGHNGAGKSTLLKLLAGVYPPTSGNRYVEGRISSLFDLVIGFEPDANGWENIRYRGYLQGESYRTLEPKIQAIADFTELGTFLDIPVRYYSAGMLIRLAFSIAAAIEPEILLIDEVLAVGDLAFQIKARKRMEELMEKARLMVLISHDLTALSGLCNKAVWMDHGKMRAIGPVDEVVRAYCSSVNPAPTAAAA